MKKYCWVVLVALISVSCAVNRQIDPFSDNVGELLEGYVKNKTTPSNLGWILEKLVDSKLGFLLGDPIPKDKMCKYCPIVFDLLILERRLGMTSIQLSGEVGYICSLLNIVNLDVCLGVVEPTMDVFTYILDNKTKVGGEFACNLILENYQCPGKTPINWYIDLPERPKTEPKKETGKNPFHVLQISDVHYEPFYTEGKSLDCGAPMCCHSDQANSKGDGDYCGKWTNYEKSDNPLKTIKAVFEKANNTNDFDYVYFTGDIVSHRVWSTSPEHNRKVITTVLDIAKETFNKPMFFVLGNHEGHPVDTFAPADVGGSMNSTWLYEIMLDYLPVNSTDDIEKTILTGGYYTASPREGLRVIVLNDNVCELEDWWNIYEYEDNNGQLKWMVNVLQQAEAKNESVHILAHIPTAHCLTVWSREFNRIVDRFANTIVGQFYGHTHKDEFYVFYNKSDITQPINAGWNGASVMADRSNPSFKVYDVDGETFRILNFKEFCFNLTDANMYRHEGGDLQWKELYSFKEKFGLKSLELDELNSLVNRMAKDHSLLQTYFRFLHRDSDYALKKGCDEDCMKTILCSIVNTEYGETSKCESLLKMFEMHKSSNL